MSIIALNKSEKESEKRYKKLMSDWKKSKKVKKRRVKKSKVAKIDYHKYIKSNKWFRKRKEALKYHGEYCRVCNSTKNLTVHHLTYKNLGREKMKDLTVLCWDHHKEHHQDMDAGEFVDK